MEKTIKNIVFSSKNPLQNQKKGGILPNVSIGSMEREGFSPSLFCRILAANASQDLLLSQFRRRSYENYRACGKLCKAGDEEKAIQIAQQKLEQCKREGKTKPSEMCPCTMVHELVGEIKGKIIKIRRK